VARLSREESRALTRSRLLVSARTVLIREGYEGASVDRIAEEAGFSKGAFYSNFGSKEEIVLELLESHSLHDVAEIKGLLDGSRDPIRVIDVVSDWAQRRSAESGWGLLALELFRRARSDATFGDRHAKLFRAQWRGLGKILLCLFAEGKAPAGAEALGGIVFELTYGAASSFKAGPSAGDMVRVVLDAMHRAPSGPAHRTSGSRSRSPAARKAVPPPPRTPKTARSKPTG